MEEYSQRDSLHNTTAKYRSTSTRNHTMMPDKFTSPYRNVEDKKKQFKFQSPIGRLNEKFDP